MTAMPLALFNMGPQEMILIFLVLLLLFGAKKLPELARGIGKSMGEFKKAREDFEREITRGEDDQRVTSTGRDDSERELVRREEALRNKESEFRLREAAGKEAREQV